MGRILVVDDEKGIRFTLSEFLRAAGHQAEMACDAQEALKQLEQGEFDLVVTDIVMPGMNGVELMHAIRKTFPRILVIVLTGEPTIDTAMEAVRAGAFDYLTKPVSKEAICKAAQSALRVKALEKEQQRLEEENRKYQENLERLVEERTAKLQKMATAIHAAAEGVVVALPDGTIEYVNPAFERMTGYAASEMLGQNPRILKSGKQDLKFYQNLWATILRGETWNGRFINKRKDGTLYEEEATISSVRDAAGAIVNYVALKRDITEKINLEKQLRQAQKMESLGLLAGGVAHDFNNLLQGILGYGKIARKSLPPDAPAYSDLEQVIKAGESAAALVRQLLLFSRRQSSEPRNVSLNKLIADMAKMLRRVIGEHLDLEIIPDEGLRHVWADPGQIEQVLMNLCVNARDAMPQGGRITIETRAIVLTPSFCQRCPEAKEGDYICLSVKDNGMGMTPEVKERIFEPFFTTKELGKGTGLGLSMVYGIVKQHEGLINVESAPGQGAQFHIYLPVSTHSDNASLSVQAVKAKGGHETILIAEDDDLVREMAVRILTETGYRTLVARDGEEALQMLESHAGQFQLLFLDIVMPKANAKEIYHRARQLCPQIPVLFCSGYSMGILDSSLRPEGVFLMIAKPYEAEALLSRIRELLDKGARQ
ncbi:MAG: response regulator [Candidatus Sumerlaeota bacterium]|nr:response regulator [Candidatus Sumerlaeota bacterium]